MNENELSNEDLDRLDEGLSAVLDVIGDTSYISDKEIREALWYYYFNIEETIEWALERITKEKEQEEKEKAKAKKGK